MTTRRIAPLALLLAAGCGGAPDAPPAADEQALKREIDRYKSAEGPPASPGVVDPAQRAEINRYLNAEKGP